MGEAFSFGCFSRVPTEQLLVNVPLQIGFTNEMISTENNTLEMRPKALNAIGVDAVRSNELLLAVAHIVVTETLTAQSLIGNEFVSKQVCVLTDELLDNRHQGLGLGILDLHGNGLTVTLYHTENRSLGLGGTALSAFGLLAFVLVGLTATEVHFIHFHVTVKRNGIVLGKQCADFLQHIPSGLLRYLAVTGELVRGNTLLVRGNEVHGYKPLAEGQVTALKDSADLAREIVLALVATETTISALGAVMLTADGADNIVTPTCFGKGVDTGLLVAEVTDDRNKALKLSEIYVIHDLYTMFSYYYSAKVLESPEIQEFIKLIKARKQLIKANNPFRGQKVYYSLKNND